MQDIVLIQGLFCKDKLLENHQRLFFRQSFPRLYQIFKRSSLAIFINQINVIISLDHFHEFDYVDIILD